MYLHNANNSATIIRKVPNPSDHISSVEEALRVSRHQHEQAHGRHGRPRNQPDNGGPHQEIPQKALNRACQVDQPRPSTAAVISRCDGGVEEAGEDAGVGAYVFEDRHGVERGLVVGLG